MHDETIMLIYILPISNYLFTVRQYLIATYSIAGSEHADCSAIADLQNRKF